MGVPGSGVGLLVSGDELHGGWLRSPKCPRACVGLLMSESRAWGSQGCCQPAGGQGQAQGVFQASASSLAGGACPRSLDAGSLACVKLMLAC